MGWPRFQTPQSLKGKGATLNSDSGSSERTLSGSSNSSSRKSTCSAITQKGPTIAFPKWAGAARAATRRMISAGENLLRELAEPPKWLTLPFDKSRRTSVASSPESKFDDIENPTMCLSSTIRGLDQHGHGLLYSQSQIASPAPTWDTLYMGHPNYEEETHVPVFSGWAAFCGAHTPPILVPRTHWDDMVAGNRQARLDEMSPTTTSATVAVWKQEKEPVRTGGPPHDISGSESPNHQASVRAD